MKKLIIGITALCLVGILPLTATAQDPEQKTPPQKKEQPIVTSAELIRQNTYTYDPAGRRDPFRDLLAGRDVKDKPGEGGIASMSIDDVVLIGITKVKGKFTAIINGPDGFPLKVKVGNRFADGFVLSINDSKVVFRKTKERGVPMFIPKDVTKEINPEER